MASPASMFDSLYCSEEHWVEDGEEDGHCPANTNHDRGQDLFWEEEELVSLSSKEEPTVDLFRSIVSDPCLAYARVEAVEWMMKVHSYYGFSVLTAVLAVNYLDRFFSKFHCKGDDEDQRRQQQRPWMTQLTSVACLYLAAKVEETQVPLLLDLQVEESRYLFEAKTIRKMELLVLSTLQWRMNPVTPLSFLDHFARRLGFKYDLYREFIRRCELVLLHVISDPRFMLYLPSTMATAVMLHVINSYDPCIKAQYQNQLSGIPGIGMQLVDDCHDLVSELATEARTLSHHANKRKFWAMMADNNNNPASPSGVMDVCFSSSDSECSYSYESQTEGSVSSSPEPLSKKRSNINRPAAAAAPATLEILGHLV